MVYNIQAGDQNSTTAREAKIVTPRPLEQLGTRAEVIGYFEEYMMQRYDELSEMRLRRPLIKSQLLEVNGDSNPSASIQNIFSRSAVRVKRIDETMFLVADTDKEIGVAEVLNDRIVAVYSALERSEFYRWSRRVAGGNPELDHVWFSGLTFSVLWDLVTQIRPPHRFTQIAFTHESVFDIDDADSGEDEVSLDEEAQDTEVAERRSAKFRLTDRIGVLKGKLAQMQEIYAPLHAISQLRFPAPDRGGHDIYADGRVTNRSDTFTGHRSHLVFLSQIYANMLRLTEDNAWYSVEDSVEPESGYGRIVGAPVVMHFREPLEQTVFDQWIKSTFERRKNRFRLWGRPIRLGATKAHVYGLDRHLWQPIFLELTACGLTAILPKGTCGNTVHRLVANVQLYLDPRVQVYVGEKSYIDLVRQAIDGGMHGSNGLSR